VALLNGTGFPTTAVVPSEFTLNATMLAVVLVVHGIPLTMAYAYVPFESTTIDEGVPFRTQLLPDVSAGELLIDETLPLPRLKLNVSISPDP
jgi:hypothetical protein